MTSQKKQRVALLVDRLKGAIENFDKCEEQSDIPGPQSTCSGGDTRLDQKSGAHKPTGKWRKIRVEGEE